MPPSFASEFGDLVHALQRLYGQVVGLQQRGLVGVGLVVVNVAERRVVHALHAQVGARVDEVAPDGKHADRQQRHEHQQKRAQHSAAAEHPVGQVEQERAARRVAAQVCLFNDCLQCGQKDHGAVFFGNLVTERRVAFEVGIKLGIFARGGQPFFVGPQLRDVGVAFVQNVDAGREKQQRVDENHANHQRSDGVVDGGVPCAGGRGVHCQCAVLQYMPQRSSLQMSAGSGGARRGTVTWLAHVAASCSTATGKACMHGVAHLLSTGTS